MWLERRFSQAQSVGNHGYRAEAHRRARKHRTQQPAEKRIENSGSDGNSDHVIEESERQILLDVANGGAAQFSRSYDSPQVTLEKSDARTFNRHIRPRAHGYAHVRRSQCRRVIDAVPRHCDYAAFILQFLYDLALFFGLYFRLGFFDLHQCGYGFRSLRAISREHNHSKALRLQRPNRSG